ncbi:MAG TPA: serine/threonine-protein kinase [Labilithrix sp.]|nr:serine/threonine-protein kinase [Labilithrix sp.]
MTLAAREESARALEPGSRIGRKLEVVRHLGEGGMGSLWVARNLTTEAEVAIKVLHPQRAEDADLHAAARFRHEANLGAKLAHRNITRVFDLIEDEDGSLILVMELLHGETLEAVRARGAISGKEAVAILVPILGALQHAHEHGVVHRDIKPSNIFLHVDPDGHTTPKLLDFGIAKMRDSSIKTRDGSVLGTPAYMSPEHVRASAEIDGRSDLFSVASVLYEVITGEGPFRADTPAATLARVLEADVDPDPRLEPRLWMEIQRALSKQPYARHASAAELASALCEAVGEPLPRSLRQPPARSEPSIELPVAPIVVPAARVDPAPVPAGISPPRPRGRLVVYGTALVLALVGVLLGFASFRHTPASSTPAVVTTAEATPTATVAPLPDPPAAIAPPSTATAPLAPEVGGSRQAAAPRVPPRRPPSPPPSQKPATSAPSIARTPGF